MGAREREREEERKRGGKTGKKKERQTEEESEEERVRRSEVQRCGESGREAAVFIFTNDSVSCLMNN